MIDDRPHVLLVDDDRGFLEDMTRLLAERYRIEIATTVKAALEAAAQHVFDAVLLDLDLGRGTDGYEVLERIHERDPGLPVIMVTKDSSLAAAVTSMRKGAVDYIDKRPDLEDLEHRIERALAEQRLAGRARVLDREVRDAWGPMVGASLAIERVRTSIVQAAAGTSPVLIVGETGTGKELVARAIGARFRRDGVFRALNCAAIPADLFESELFGSERGAYSGSVRRIVGAFEEAREGILFLDEITEVQPALQAKLLRVIEEGEFRSLGGGPRIAFRGRVLASTNRDPTGAVRDGALREDLYFRLATFVIRVPALRERLGDIPLLAEHFVARTSGHLGRPARPLEPELLRRLCAYDWPGNVRQLQSAIERYLTGAPVFDIATPSDEDEDDSIWTDDLLSMPYKLAKDAVLRRFQRRLLRTVIASVHGDTSAAASSLGISAFGLQKMLRAIEVGGGGAEGGNAAE